MYSFLIIVIVHHVSGINVYHITCINVKFVPITCTPITGVVTAASSSSNRKWITLLSNVVGRMTSTAKALRQWTLPSDATITKFEQWKSNLLYSIIVWHISHALLGNGGKLVFATVLISLKVTKNHTIDRFLKKAPVWLFWPLFDPGGQKKGSKREIPSQKVVRSWIFAQVYYFMPKTRWKHRFLPCLKIWSILGHPGGHFGVKKGQNGSKVVKNR